MLSLGLSFFTFVLSFLCFSIFYFVVFSIFLLIFIFPFTSVENVFSFFIFPLNLSCIFYLFFSHLLFCTDVPAHVSHDFHDNSTRQHSNTHRVGAFAAESPWTQPHTGGSGQGHSRYNRAQYAEEAVGGSTAPYEHDKSRTRHNKFQHGSGASHDNRHQ